MGRGHEVGAPSSASGLLSCARIGDSHRIRDWRPARKWGAGFLASGLLLVASAAHAQVQRTMVNTGFEQPAMGTGCVRFFADTGVPGWITTEPNRGGLNTTTCQGAPIPGTAGTGRPLEFWGFGFMGSRPRAGNAFVELNAFNPARLRQDVCLLNGETVDWNASHRGRSSNTVGDIMEFRIGAVPIARMTTAADGDPRSITPSLGTANTPVLANNGWVDYGGQFAYTGATGTVDLGFAAIFATGGAAAGNFLDNIQINLRPFVEFAQAAYDQNEGSPTGNRPRLIVAGTVPAGGMTVPVTVTGGTATLGLDYTTASGTADVSVFVPAGVYDNASFPLPITIVNDGPGDPGETITFNTPDTGGTGAPYNRASLQSCGGAPLADTVSTISEDPDPLPRIQLSKALSANRLAVSDQFVLRITGPNGQQTTTTGAGSAVGNGTITVGPAAVGTAYTLSEVMAAGSASPLTAYVNSIACTNTTPNSSTVLPSGTGSSFNLTVLATDNISCTLTNDVATAPAFIDVVKTVTTGQLYDEVGDIATYSYVVTNTGPSAVNTLTVTDNRIAVVNCGGVTTLPAGGSATCTGSYTITQNDIDDVLVTNVVTASARVGVGPFAIDTDDAVINRAFPAMTANKQTTTTTYTSVGQVIPYTYVVTNTGNTPIDALTVTDNRIAAVVCPVTTLAVGATTTCTGDYTITQADIDAGTVTNLMSATGTPPAGTLGPITDTVTIAATPATPALTLDKSSTTATYASVGEVVSYNYLVTNTGNVTISALVVTDNRIATVTCPATTLAPGANTTCTGSYTIAQPDMDAGLVTNNASATGTPARGTLAPATDSATVTSTATPALTLDKTVTAGNPYAAAGDIVSYQYLVTNPSSITINALSVTDDKIATVTCPVATLAPGTSTTCDGSYTIVQADLDAGSVTNNAIASGTPASGTLVPGTDSATAIALPSVGYAKTANTAGPVVAGDIIVYTLSATVAYTATTDAVTLTDTLGPGLEFIGVTSAGAFSCNASNPLICTLPTGTAPGTYTVTYQARVEASASGTVNNAVVGSGADNPICSASCAIATPVAAPVITLAKSSNPAAGTEVQFGESIEYTLTATVSNSATLGDLVLVDTPDPGLTIGALPNGCSMSGATITCTLPAGTLVGVYSFVYSATVNAQAAAAVSNQVAGTVSAGQQPVCNACSITHQVLAPQLRVTKTAAVREIKIGDLVRYTLTVENVGDNDLIDGSLVDTPAAGLSYVEGSLQVIDGDNLARVEGQNPLRFNGLDIVAGQTATLTYLMRVGAGVRPGMHQNRAQAYSPAGRPISNVATAEVELVADPLLDDSLIMGTVFDDRDGDGWQDNAALSGVHVQGGFAPAAYIAQSTVVDRGSGPQPEPDASAALLHGIDVGAIAARQSDADPAENHQLIVRQRLSALVFTPDFVLTSAQGVTVKMDAEGNSTVEKHGDADKGLNAAAPMVERRVAQGEGGYVVDYVIRNAGIDERGIPGVRIASVEGLLIETDQYGRYHLAGMPGGPSQRGRNFILKVDPSTLPAGTQFTTDNPLLRRITPGLPVRFDFGVKLPVQPIAAGAGQTEMALGEVFFAAGSAEVRPKYLPVIEKMAAKVREHRVREVVIDANGGTETLAFERATAVREALLGMLGDDASAKRLVVSARGNVDKPDSLVVSVAEGGALLGAVLFDTDKSSIRPEFEPLLDEVAAALERKRGGAIAIVGHADVRGSHEYNTALGMRRAKAVYEALARRLSPQVRAKVRVEASGDPDAPVGTQRKQGGR